jgi:hypothetical protein
MRHPHQIVGYDPVTEREAFAATVSEDVLRQLFKFDDDDPDGDLAYDIDYALASKIVGPGLPPNLEYQVDPRVPVNEPQIFIGNMGAAAHG